MSEHHLPITLNVPVDRWVCLSGFVTGFVVGCCVGFIGCVVAGATVKFITISYSISCDTLITYYHIRYLDNRYPLPVALL